MQFLRIAAVLSLVAAVGTEVRAEWFSINNAISQAVLTNPGVGEASANRRATESRTSPPDRRTKTDRARLRRGWE